MAITYEERIERMLCEMADVVWARENPDDRGVDLLPPKIMLPFEHETHRFDRHPRPRV